MTLLKKIMVVALIIVAGILIWFWFSIKPSNDRDWSVDQAILAKAEIDGHLVTLRNVRNFTYKTKSEYTPAYYDKTFDLEKIVRAWFVAEPFEGFPGAAHTFLSFEFEGDEFVGISAEIRKEKGEHFSPLNGLFKQYELMYVVGDERDLIKLRSNFRKDEVYVYPMRGSKEFTQKLFLSMVERLNAISEKPEFYNSISNTCMTNIMSHVNAFSTIKIPLRPAIVLPAYSDRLMHESGLLDTDLPFTEAKALYHINARALKYSESPDFSRRIRAIE